MVVKTVYKVRLEDGMEVGPLDGEMIRSWYQQGMVNPDTALRAQGSKRWVRLADTFETASWGEPQGTASPAAEEERDAYEAEARQSWRTYFACALFFLLALGAGYFSLFPSMWRIPPNTPWREIALGFVVLGLLLVRGWDAMRKLARVLVLILTLALFPLAEVLIFRGVPWRNLIVLIPAVVMGFGLFFFLSGRYKPWPRVVLNLFWIFAGAAGVVVLGAFPPPAVAAWMAAPSPLPEALRPAMLPDATQPAAPVATLAPRPEPAAPAPASLAPSAAAAPLGAPSVAAVIQEVPLLSPGAAEAVRLRAVFAPEDAFRRSYELAGNGVAALDPRERGELGELMAAAYAHIPGADRRRLEAYMNGIRGGQISTSEQNREMSALMRGAVLKLTESQRARLQALYEKAILAAR